MIAKRTRRDPPHSGAAASSGSICCRIAATFEERREALRLLHDNYVRAGLSHPAEHQLRVLPHHLLATSTIFIAVQNSDVVRTATLVADGELGLPMESTFPEEVRKRRESGIRLGEFCCLADNQQLFAGSFPAFVKLNRLMAQFARRQGIEEMLIEVHPRHVRAYREFLAFKPLGDTRDCSIVCDRPAVPLLLNFAELDRQRTDQYDLFFADAVPEEALVDSPISMEEGEFFSGLIGSEWLT